MLRVYYYASLLLWPFIWLYVRVRLIRGKEDVIRLGERFGRAPLPRPKGKLIWIHGASVGESNSVVPLMNRLSELYPAMSILLTTGTKSSAKTIQGRLPERAFHQYVPVDAPRAVKRFIKHWKPDLAIWVESELWPNLVQHTHMNKIPMMLINARISKRSYSRWLRFRNAFLTLMNGFQIIFAGSDEDARLYKNLGASNVHSVGNLKYDAPTLPADPSVTSGILGKIGDRRIWVASSTHAGEEEMIAEAHVKLREVFPELLTILVPRHATRGQEIAELLARRKLTVSARSKKQKILPETDMYVADTMGELGIFYRLAGIVFIGGSLVPHGGHNPIEPAQLDCALLCGPHMHNFEGMCQYLKQEQALIEVDSAESLVREVGELLRDHDLQEAKANAAHRAVEERQGAVEPIVQNIAKMLQLPLPEEEAQITGDKT